MSLLGDADGDGSIDADDLNAWTSASGASIGAAPAAGYRADVDFNRDGVIDADDLNIVILGWGASAPAMDQLSTVGGAGCDIGYGGALYDHAVGLYNMRKRWYAPARGGWLTRDPAGYVDGMSLYLYVRGNPLRYFDRLGLSGCDTIGFWDHVGATIGGFFRGAGEGVVDMAVGVGTMAREIPLTITDGVGMTADLVSTEVFDTPLYYEPVSAAGKSGETIAAIEGPSAAYAESWSRGREARDGLVTLGVKPLVETALDDARTGDFSNTSQQAGQMVVGNILGLKTAVRPTRAASAPRSVESLLQTAATNAAKTVGPGKGSVHGTKVHTQFRNNISAMSRADIHPEVSYLRGEQVRYGTPGSVRVDVVVGTPSHPRVVYDLKTGTSTLTLNRMRFIQQHLPRGQSIPIHEIRP